MKAFCALTVSQDIRLVTTVSRFISEVSMQLFVDEELASRILVTAHELLENAVRYSKDDESTIRIEFATDADTIRITIDTVNRTDAKSRMELTSLFADMMASPSRDAFYQSCMRRTAKRTDGSGLGLGRIHAESLMDLSCEIEGELVRLRAEATLPAAKGDHP